MYPTRTEDHRRAGTLRIYRITIDLLPPLQGEWLSEKIVPMTSVKLRFHNWDCVEDE